LYVFSPMLAVLSMLGSVSWPTQVWSLTGLSQGPEAQ
jgi:hypothetical protein